MPVCELVGGSRPIQTFLFKKGKEMKEKVWGYSSYQRRNTTRASRGTKENKNGSSDLFLIP